MIPVTYRGWGGPHEPSLNEQLAGSTCRQLALIKPHLKESPAAPDNDTQDLKSPYGVLKKPENSSPKSISYMCVFKALQ